jgi:hypothetical protein
MILSLLWLTVCTPFVYKAQQKLRQLSHQTTNPYAGAEDNPLTNTTEEKAPTSISLTEEYLHEHNEFSGADADKLQHDLHHSYDVYVAFHGELISPPPDLFLS